MWAMNKRRLAAYFIAAIAYLALIGLVSSRSPLLGVSLLAATIALLVYLRYGRQRTSRLKIPILRLRNKYSASFYTDAPEIEVRYALSLGEELGAKTKAVLTKLPNTDIRAHKIIVYTTSLTEKASKQKLSSALKSMVTLLSLKGYRVVPDTSVDESLLEENEASQLAYPIIAVADEEDYGFAASKTFELTGEATMIVADKTHLAKAVRALSEGSPEDVGVVRFAQNFGFDLFDQTIDVGLFADVAQACFGLSNESTLLIASTVAKARREGHRLDPFSLCDMLEGEAQSRGLSARIRDELAAFQETIKTDTVWRGLVKDHFPSPRPRKLVVDLSRIGPPRTASFIAYMLAHKLAQKGEKVVLDLASFPEQAVAHALNDLRLTHTAAFLLPKTRLKKEYLRGFGTLLYVGADALLKEFVGSLGVDAAQIQEKSSYIVAKSGSVNPVAKRGFGSEIDEARLEELVRATAKPLEVEDLSAKPYITTLFGEKELEAIIAALSYLEKYTTVEETAFQQALGPKTKSAEITSKLVRLGYLKRKRKGGITFLELTPRGHEELERLRQRATRKDA